MSTTIPSRGPVWAVFFLFAVLEGVLPSCASVPAEEYEERDASPEVTLDANGDRVPTAKTLQTMAHILAKNGNDPQCELVLRKLIDSHSEFAPAYNELAELFMRHDRSDEAIGVLEAGVASIPEDSVLWNNLGMVHLLRDELDAARLSFTRACAVAPSDARPRANLAVSLAMSGRLEEAEAVYLQATTRTRAYHDLSVLCEARGDMENARLYLELSEGKRPKRKSGP